MRLTRPFLAVAALLALPLAGCGDDAAERTPDDAREAAGEVKGGTISDAMLPLDRLQSQSPPLKNEAPSTADADGVDGDEQAGGEENVGPDEAAADEAEASAAE